MSALGQKRTLGHVRAMSALPPKADIDQHGRHVRFVPEADSCTAAILSLFEHLVGAATHRSPIIRFLQCPIYPTSESATARQGNRPPNDADVRPTAAGNPSAYCDPVRPYADTGARLHFRAAPSPP